MEAPTKSGITVDDGLHVDVSDQKTDVTGIHVPKPMIPKKARNNVKNSLTIIETSLLGSDADHQTTYKLLTTASETRHTITATKSQTYNLSENKKDSSISARALAGLNLSPKIEMRLALRHDIMGDEDLMFYNPGTNLTSILGHDLSTFQRLTGRDLLNCSANQSDLLKEGVTLCSQQRNSKMDTPTVNRRPPPNNNSINYEQQEKHQLSTYHQQQQTPMAILGLGGGLARVGGVPQHLQPNRNTWSSSAFVVPNRVENVANDAAKKNVNAFSNSNDLERSAKQETTYCMSQSKSGFQQAKKTRVTTMNKDLLANHPLKRSTSTKSMYKSEDIESDECSPSVATHMQTRKIGCDESALMEIGKGNRLINFIKRRNSVINHISSVQCSPSTNKISIENNELTQTTLSSRKDVDKPSLNRRLWKQITRRRRASSMSEIVANS